MKIDAFELVVLAVLAEAPLYGYAISKRVEGRSEGGLRLSPGVLYPLLRGMEKEGLIVAEWEEVRREGAADDETGRKRKWYRLSAKGKKRLEQRVKAHRAHQAMMEAFLGRPPDSVAADGKEAGA